MKKGINEVKIMLYEWALVPSQTNEKALCAVFTASVVIFISGFLAFLAIF